MDDSLEAGDKVLQVAACSKKSLGVTASTSSWKRTEVGDTALQEMPGHYLCLQVSSTRFVLMSPNFLCAA